MFISMGYGFGWRLILKKNLIHSGMFIFLETSLIKMLKILDAYSLHFYKHKKRDLAMVTGVQFITPDFRDLVLLLKYVVHHLSNLSP